MKHTTKTLSWICAALLLINAASVTAQSRVIGAGALRLDDGAGNTLTLILPSPTTWTGNINIPLPTSGFVGVSGAAGGDLSGTYPDPTVAAINGATLGSTAATSGNLLIGQGTSWVSEPVTGDVTITSAGVTSIGAGTVTSTDLASTLVSPGTYGSATQVGTFTVDQQGRITSASNVTITSAGPEGLASGDLGNSYPDPIVTGLNGVPLGSTTATSGNLLIGQGTSWVSEPVAGDVTITSTGTTTISPAAVTTSKISTVGATAAGQSLIYDGTNVLWGTATTVTASVTGFAISGVPATPYQIPNTANLVAVSSNSGVYAVTLPKASSVAPGYVIIVKDQGLDADANNITINAFTGDQIGTNTGAVSSQTITLKGGIERYYSDGGTNWFLW